MPDTLKAQHIARLTKGYVLYSDMPHSVSIIEDTVGWHDPIGGASKRGTGGQQFGTARYQEFRNDLS